MAFRSYELWAMRWLLAEVTRRQLGPGRGRRVVRRMLLGPEAADKGPLWPLRVIAWGLVRRIWARRSRRGQRGWLRADMEGTGARGARRRHI